jgi:hypothetical protein
MKPTLTDLQGLRDFERSIIELIAQSHLIRADFLLSEAVDQLASTELRNAAQATADTASVENWNVIIDAFHRADEFFEMHHRKSVRLATLSLVDGGTATNHVNRRCQIEPRYYDALERDPQNRCLPAAQSHVFAPDADPSCTVYVAGLDDLVSIHQRYNSGGSQTQTQALDFRLASLLIATRCHLALDRNLHAPGLPRPIEVVCQMDAASPNANRQIEPAGDGAPHSGIAAEELREERIAGNRATFQTEWERYFAQCREIHRMLRYFPFYRARGRASLAEMWEDRLTMTCDIVGIDPDRKISWRMSARELTDILCRIAKAKNVPDVSAALEPAHTDALHMKWLAIAKAANFKLGVSISLFELQLAAALHKGGPWVHNRWERAKPYYTEH